MAKTGFISRCLLQILKLVTLAEAIHLQGQYHMGQHTSSWRGSVADIPSVASHAHREDNFPQHTSMRQLPAELQPPLTGHRREALGSQTPHHSPAAPLRWNWKSSLAVDAECAARTAADELGRPYSPSQELSVVISFCDGDLSLLSSLTCKSTWFFVFSRCGKATAEVAEALPRISECLTVAKSDGSSDAEVHLKFIIDKGDKLSPRTLFTSLSALEELRLSAAETVAAAGQGPQLAFRALGGPRRRLSMHAFSEACYVIQRYTCIRACSHSVMPFARQWYRYAPHGTFVASSDRIRSLSRNEYKWLRDYSVRTRAAQAVNTGEYADIVGGLWGFVLGCPQDAAAVRPSGCQEDQWFGRGTSTEPYIRAARGAVDIRKALVHEVVRRDKSLGDPVVRAGRPAIGIVLVFCEENLGFLEEVGCDNVGYHLYSKCGASEEEARAMAPVASKCFKSFKKVPLTLETELAWPKHHAEYLEHIITRYSELEPWTMFVKANLEKRRLNLGDMVSQLLENKWGFYSFGNPKIPVNMTSFPETGNVPVWQREICALYRRYTAMDPCQMDDKYMKQIGFEPYHYNTRSMWSASRPRIHSLPVTEYQWLREYIMSITFEEGVKRRYVMERMWQGLLGCPQELRTRQMLGCTSAMWHPRGQAVEPPGVLVADALVTWPQIDHADFNPSVAYPSFFRIHNTTRVTFVGSYVGGMDSGWQVVMLSIFVAAAKLHPDCGFVMLTDLSTPKEMFLPDLWLGRMEVRRYDIKIPSPADLTYKPPQPERFSFYQAHGLDPEDSSPLDWEGDAKLQRWIAAASHARLHLETCFLRDVMAGVQQGYFGNLVFMDFTAYFTNNASRIFESIRSASHVPSWHAGIVVRPVEDVAAATSIWYVHQSHAMQSWALMTAAVQMADDPQPPGKFPGEGRLDLHSKAVTRVLHCCLRGQSAEWWRSSHGPQTLACDLEACGVKRAPELRLRLFPCSSYLPHVGGSFVPDCPMDTPSPEVVRNNLALKWGFRELTSMVYGLFKIKDKSTGYVSISSALHDFMTIYGTKYPRVAQQYNDTLRKMQKL
uniref:Uncharacterized protein n=1 Tax=Tetraselmis sp. GSL018 TaxID=582737 RepID=A0A061S5E4_9CHLO|eukprot:CAMPEP_0177604324 /NCGR_PEP_ID=MMETSP0419_2-20121207/16053_1 /TAXON_ID=582737 /ORGANISM="Tetraselmis sp., Strain GSL018" /LENGTH=1058 /DNA_ID=CAMNT_0019098291 /DNA_START=287 /DNA_END=3463 /DNA_ORIENTATION=-